MQCFYVVTNFMSTLYKENKTQFNHFAQESVSIFFLLCRRRSLSSCHTHTHIQKKWSIDFSQVKMVSWIYIHVTKCNNAIVQIQWNGRVNELYVKLFFISNWNHSLKKWQRAIDENVWSMSIQFDINVSLQKFQSWITKKK